VIREMVALETLPPNTSANRAAVSPVLTFRAQWQHNLVNTGQPALSLFHGARIERGAGVPRHVDLYRPDLGQHGLRARRVAGIPPPTAGHVVLFVAEVLAHFRFRVRHVTIVICISCSRAS
jgi:hypothetical protein